MHLRNYCSLLASALKNPRVNRAPITCLAMHMCSHDYRCDYMHTTTMTTTHSFSTTTSTTTTTDHRHLCQDFTYDHSFWSCSTDDEHFAGQEHVFNKLGLDVLDNAFEGYVYPSTSVCKEQRVC